MLSGVFARLRALLLPGATRNEIDEEQRAHFEREVERQIGLGLSELDAKYAARRAFGNRRCTAKKRAMRTAGDGLTSFNTMWATHFAKPSVPQE